MKISSSRFRHKVPGCSQCTTVPMKVNYCPSSFYSCTFPRKIKHQRYKRCIFNGDDLISASVLMRFQIHLHQLSVFGLFVFTKSLFQLRVTLDVEPVSGTLDAKREYTLDVGCQSVAEHRAHTHVHVRGKFIAVRPPTCILLGCCFFYVGG